MRIIFLLIIVLIIEGCFAFKQLKKDRLILNSELSTHETIKIYYNEDQFARLFTIIIKNGNTLSDRYEVRDNPQRIIIDKLILSSPAINSVYRLVSDTGHGTIKCLDYIFLENYSTKETLSTFTKVTDREKEILELLAHSLKEANLEFIFSNQDISRIIGFVRINY